MFFAVWSFLKKYLQTKVFQYFSMNFRQIMIIIIVFRICSFYIAGNHLHMLPDHERATDFGSYQPLTHCDQTTTRPRPDHDQITARPRPDHERASHGFRIPIATYPPRPDHDQTTTRPRPDHEWVTGLGPRDPPITYSPRPDHDQTTTTHDQNHDQTTIRPRVSHGLGVQGSTHWPKNYVGPLQASCLGKTG